MHTAHGSAMAKSPGISLWVRRAEGNEASNELVTLVAPPTP